MCKYIYMYIKIIKNKENISFSAKLTDQLLFKISLTELILSALLPFCEGNPPITVGSFVRVSTA